MASTVVASQTTASIVSVVPSNAKQNITLYPTPPSILSNNSSSLTRSELETTRNVATLACAFLPTRAGANTIDADSILGIVREAYVAASDVFGAREAQKWADGFVFPREARQRDQDIFVSTGYNIEALCTAHHNALASNRLSISRITDLLGEHGEKCPAVSQLDLARLKKIAREGVTIQTPSGFSPSRLPPPRRVKYLQVANAINKLLYAQFQNKTVILLPTALALGIPGIHFSPQHWAPKKGKEQGRSICDTANSTSGIPINGKGTEGKNAVRAQVAEEWGAIHHPTIDELVQMVLEMADQHGWDDIELWKTDLAGAFNLIRFNPTSVRLLAFELTEGMTAIHITGMFGWTGTPYAFDVVTRVLRALSRQRIQGRCNWYVDDNNGCSRKGAMREQDMNTVMDIIHRLLGPDAVAMHKNEYGRRVEFVGWLIDLDERVVTIARHSFLKTVHAFFSVDIEKSVYHEEVEVIASLASRYSMLCRQMRPFTQSLYGFLSATREQKHAKRFLSERAKTDIQMWRAFLCQLDFNEAHYARSLESFRPRKPTVMIEYDASLGAYGVGVSVLDNLTSKYTLRAFASLGTPLGVRADSSYQNVCEYGAVVLGLLLAKHLGLYGFAYQLVGDSVSSLTWSANDRASSEIARATNIGFAMASVEIDAVVAEIRHVPGVDNVVYDGLSRGKDGSEVGLDDCLRVIIPPGGWMERYIHLCDPTCALETPLEHNILTRSLLDLLRHN